MSPPANLACLKILALDCQATGANPTRGHLLEIGWIAGCAATSALAEISSADACLIKLPTQMTIPPAVQRLTGISETSMVHAVPALTAWHRVRAAAQAVASRDGLTLCPTVVHFARFEEPFLQWLHKNNDLEDLYPFHIICTHAIALRLLPSLPRRSIRALAGYLGHSMPELKRSAGHALATLTIWKGMVELLQTRCRIHSLQQLTEWLAATPIKARVKRIYPMNPDIRLTLPDRPGVYRMRRSNGDILYIGKAKSLKQRVNSYFRPHTAHPEHILEMLSQAHDLDFSPTGSALEAAVLESDEIKLHQPPYNIALLQNRRSLVFCTPDLQQYSKTCADPFCIGPLPGGRLIETIEAFVCWTLDGSLPGYGSACNALFPAQAPQEQCLKEGFKLFRDKHRQRLRNRSMLRTVTLLGADLWRERLQTMGMQGPIKCEGNPEMLEEAIGSVEGFACRPDDVAAAMESMVMRIAHPIRRSRWFCMLCESCLAWDCVDDPKMSKHLLVFERGGILHQGLLKGDRKMPDPPGRGRPWHERRKNLDLLTYDRMRVVTTELRRLVRAGRKIELRLGPQVSLTLPEVKKALDWI